MTQGERRILVDGELRESRSGKTFDNINPATEEVLGVTTDADLTDADEAIAAARRAFDETDWSTNHAFRKKCLLQLQEALEAEREEIRAELIAEVGAPILLTYGPQLDGPLADGILWPANYIDEFEWESDLPEGSAFGMRSWRKQYREPVGVIGAITPWNYPFEITVNKLAQGLATGNTIVLKGAPDTPWTTTRFARVIAEKTDIPAGVVNVLMSSDHMVGEAFVTDPRVDMISFTGSTAVGRRIMEKGAPTLKRLFLELGGKSADVVLDDADFETALAMKWTITVHGGQGCAMSTRLLLPRSRYEEGLKIVQAGMEAAGFGDPTQPLYVQGPQINARQRDRIRDLIQSGIDQGARCVVGGPEQPEGFDKGYYVKPTLFADVDNSMRIAQEEIFGPVLVVIPFEDDDDAVRIANESQYGLSGAVTSGSDERALAVAKRIRTGTVGVNNGLWYGPDAAFGGYKASGIGRQNGVAGFLQHTETKVIAGGLPPLEA